MGRTVAELDASLSPDELLEWQAFYEFEPFGAPVEDQRWETACALTYVVNAKAGSDVPVFFDRDPEETSRRRAQVAEAELDAKLESYFTARIDPSG